eukprot:gene4576-14924_t
MLADTFTVFVFLYSTTMSTSRPIDSISPKLRDMREK